jgi:thiol-disulfide isomerase/thioredoxin
MAQELAKAAERGDAIMWKMWKRSVLASLAAAVFAGAAAAAEVKPFDAAAFRAAQAEGKAIVVEVMGQLCPPCRYQRTVLDDFYRQPEFEKLIVFQIDFDRQRDIARSFNVNSQGTLIAFRDGKERARAVGESESKHLAKFLRSLH